MKNLDDLRKKRKISKDAELKVLMDTAFQLGRILERARTIKGKTQKELATKIGSTQSVVAKIENGSKLPSFSFLQRIADAFETYIVPPKFGFMEEQKEIVDRISIWFCPVKSEEVSVEETRYENKLTSCTQYAS